ncbi:MAG: cytidine deaminase [bacterium]|nr:cytidine deaminase [bacterium]
MVTKVVPVNNFTGEEWREVKLLSLTAQQRRLVDAAKEALQRAYNPYSGFSVGAALRTGKGIVLGTNVENAAYGSSICAERSALVSANAQGLGDSCTAIAIVIRGASGISTADVSAPCGECRQFLWEFAVRSGVRERFEVILATHDLSQVVVTNIGYLLPRAFGPSDLEEEPRA